MLFLSKINLIALLDLMKIISPFYLYLVSIEQFEWKLITPLF